MASVSSRPRLLALCLALIAGLNFFAYSPSLFAPFVFDDYPNILEKPQVRAAGAGRASLLEMARPRLHARRPLAYLSFALNLRLFGLDPLPFHLVNLAIHVANAWVLFALILTIIQATTRRRPGTTPGLLPALAGALFWSLHPVQVQAVTYIVQRMTSLATLGYLLAFLLWLLARRQTRSAARVGLFLAAALVALLGFLTKEILITLPLALLLAELCGFPDPQPLRQRRLLPRMAAAILAGYGALGLGFGPGLLREIALYSQKFPASLAERLLTQPRVIVSYLTLLLWPHLSRLNLDPVWTLSTGLLSPWTTAPALLALAALLGLGLYWLRARPLPAFALLFFPLALLPESGLYPLDPAFEHRLYLPSSALLALLGAAGAWPGQRQTARRSLLALGLVWLSLLTFSRNLTWSDDVRLWQDTVRKSPGSSRAWLVLAKHLSDLGKYPEAIQADRRSLAILPCGADTLSNLGGAYLGLRRFEEARKSFEQALQCDPNYDMAKAGIQLAEQIAGNPVLQMLFPPPAGFEEGGDEDGSGKLFRRGYSRLRDGRDAEAVRDLRRAVQLQPGWTEAKALLRMAEGRLETKSR